MPTYYDPNHAPSPRDWLELDEQERIDQAEQYHQKNKIRLPNTRAHSALHAVVENQIAEQKDAVVRAMERLSRQGLSRHDCIHAISWVLALNLYEIMKSDNEDTKEIVNARYFATVERLQADEWLAFTKE